MNLRTANLKWIFGISLLATLLLPALYPNWHLLYFAPFLITLIYQLPLSRSLWGAFFAGLALDLLSPYHHLGLYALNFCLTTALLYPLRLNFFSDTLTTLPIMTFFFSALSTLLHALLLLFLESKLSISFSWILTDLLLYPAFDALFAFAVFVLPGFFRSRFKARA